MCLAGGCYDDEDGIHRMVKEDKEEGEILGVVLTASAAAYLVQIILIVHPIILCSKVIIFLFFPPTIWYRYIFHSDINRVSSILTYYFIPGTWYSIGTALALSLLLSL